ncbi:MAG TPA: adenylate/guanylate cyclase domain-containing protein [Jatrophihabitantaceae bacterium]|nr:adenylate/guanylate cyclase domain-containing protein [Jatrophihabitantaceae bacterium]
MACANCGSELPPGVRFCVQCGTPLDLPCGNCGAALVPGARFCGSCGAAIGATPAATSADAGRADVPAPIGSERRVCSVLFADLVGFTPLSESRDPEDVRELLSRYFDVARTIVTRHGGVVEKFIGDAVMAVWGTPVATEEDAERAVRAGLELVDAVKVLGNENGIEGLAARAGVVTGEVAVTLGAVGEGMVAGDAVNTAARVQAASSPGSVFVDSATRRLSAASIGYADAGVRELKGKAEPEQLWQVTRVLAAVGGAQRVDGLEAPLVGRDSELRLVKELFHASADRRTARLVVVAGAPGVGKSRLGWEFEKYIDGLAQLIRWHRGRCLSYGEGIAFWALAEAVRQRLGIAEDDPTSVAAERMAATLPDIVKDADERSYVAARLSRLLGLPGDGGTENLTRDELFAGWRIFFERMAAESAVALLIEDAQHADAGLLDFIDHLIDWSRELPIFVMVLTRPELEERRAGFGVGRNRTALTLDPLDAASMDALVEGLVPGIPDQARAAITEHAQGVPLFAVETVRSLVDRDVVQPIDGVYRLVGDVGALSVPDSLHALLSARLDALPPDVRTLVADVAVLGTSFAAEAVIAVCDLPEDVVRAGLAELLRREVLQISADPLSPQRGEYRFAQQLLRQVAYDTLSRHERKRRHLAVAAYLRATFADDGEEVSDAIARHYHDALSAGPDDPDADEIRAEAIRIWVRAAERALRAGAPVTAVGIYARAAELAEQGGADENLDRAAELWEEASRAARIATAVVPGMESADRAVALYRQRGRDRDAARALSLAGSHAMQGGQLTLARQHLIEALEVLSPEPDVATVFALSSLAHLDALEGSAESDARTAQALELGQALDVHDELMAQLFISRGIAHSIANRAAQAAASLEYAARLTARAGLREAEAVANLNLSDTIASVDPRAAAEAARIGAERARQVGAWRRYMFSISNQVEALLTMGDWDEAESVLQSADAAEFEDARDLIPMCLVRLRALRGDEDGVRSIVASVNGFDGFRTSEDPQDQGAVALADAMLTELSGDRAMALRHAKTGAAYESAMGIRAETVRWSWALAARLAHELRDTNAQGELLAMLDRHAIGELPLLLRAERDLVRAQLAADSGDGDADELFCRAIEGLRRIPAVFHLAHALLDHAEFLSARGDANGADMAVSEAAEIADRLGAKPLARRAALARDRATVG